MGYGAVFGIVIWVFFHLILMPLMHTVPAPWNQPFQEHLSELFGHIVWMMTIEGARQLYFISINLNFNKIKHGLGHLDVFLAHSSYSHSSLSFTTS